MRTALPLIVSLFYTLLALNASYANPIGGEVSSGSATISQPDANTTQINQTTDKAIINWQSFNIAPNEATHFQQPSTSSITLNRINPSQGASQIFGQLTANGRLILVNQAGIFFGPTAHVDVAGLIATTSDISDQNFLAGKYIFDKPSPYNGTVINKGTIIAAEHGLVALVGANVSNEGLIKANTGSVVLASGNKFTVDLTGDGLINFVVDEATTGAGKDENGNVMHDAVSNSGKIIANGGTITMTANTAQGVVDNVVNMSGVAVAHSVYQHNGEIILGGNGPVRVSGKLIASGKKSGQTGGTIKVLGKNIVLQSPAVLDASGDLGGGEILIGGDAHGSNPAISNSYITLLGPGTKINADAISNGDGGKIVVWADGYTGFFGNISARGGVLGGNGGWVETSGHEGLAVSGATVDTLAPLGETGSWLLDPKNIIVAAGGTATLTDVATFASQPSATLTIDPATIDSASSNVTLSANNDIIFNSDIAMTNSGISLTASALRTITINANISTNNGDLNLTANLVSFNRSDRDAGLGVLTLASGTSINTGTGAVNLTVDVGGTTFVGDTEGPMTLSGSITGGAIDLRNDENTITDTGDITASTSLTLAPGGASSTSTSTFSGIISGSGTLISQSNVSALFGVGVSLTGNNTYTGATSITSGILSLVSTTALGNTPSISVASGGGATLDIGFSNNTLANKSNITLNGGNGSIGGLTITGTGDALSNAIILAGNSGIGGAGSGTLSGVISGTRRLTKAGSGTIALTGTNTYSGATAVNAGTLVISADSGLGTAPVSATINKITFGGGTLETTNTFTLNANRGISVNSGGGTISPDSGTTLTYNGIMAGSNAFTKSGNGTLILGGANTNSAGDTVSAGILQLNSNSGLGTGSGTVNSGAELLLNGVSITNALTLTGTGVSNAGALATTGSSSNTINAAVSLNGDTTIGVTNSGDSLTFGSSGTISGPGGLIKTGSGTLTLATTNTYSGATTINAGTLITSNASALGQSSSVITIGSSGTLQINTSSISNPVTMNGGTLTGTGTSSLAGNITLNNASTFSTNSSSDSFTLNGSLDGASTLTLSGPGNIVIAGVVGGNTPLSSLISNANTNISNNITAANQTYNSSVTFSSNPTLVVQSGNMSFGGSISGNANLVSNDSNNALLLQNSSSQSWNMSGANSGSVSVGGTLGFSGFGNITGGSGNNNFAFADGASLSGTLNGGANTSGNTVNYSAYASPVQINMSAASAGNILNNNSQIITNFINIGNAITPSNSTLQTANKTNTIHITSGGVGYIVDPFNFNGIYTIIGQGATSVVLDTNGVLNLSNNTITIGSVTMSLINIPFSNISGNVSISGSTSASTSASASTSTSISASAIATLYYALLQTSPTQAYIPSQQPSLFNIAPQSIYIDGNVSSSNNSNKLNSSTDDTYLNTNWPLSPTEIVNQNLNQIIQNQSLFLRSY